MINTPLGAVYTGDGKQIIGIKTAEERVSNSIRWTHDVSP